MFGNRFGWGISAAIAVVLGLIVWMFVKMDTISKPSTGAISRTKPFHVLELPTHPEMLAEIKFPYDPASVVPSMTKPGDAGAIYMKAIDEYEKSSLDYVENSRNKSENPDDYPAIKLLIEAKDLTSMKLYPDRPEALISHNLEPKPIQALRAVGYRAADLALRILRTKDQAEKTKRTPDALAMAEAAFSLGTKLCQDRVRWMEFDAGYQMVTRSAPVIAEIDPARAPACKAAVEGLYTIYKDRGMPLAHAFTSIDLDVMGRTAGDMFYIVKNARERMWRVEAVLKLGHYKFNAGEPGNAADQRWAKLIAKRVMNDASEDSAVRAAAKLSYELTMENYLKIGSN
jgi:hypothetical protein